MKFRVVIKSCDDKDYAKFIYVTSPEHACNFILICHEEDKRFNDCQWSYGLEEFKNGEWVPWSDENYSCIEMKLLDLLEDNDERNTSEDIS